MFGAKLAVGIHGRPWRVDLPAPFEGIGAGDYLAYLDLLGVAESTPAAEDVDQGDPSSSYHIGPRGSQLPLDTALKIVEAGHAVILGWPDSFYSLLERVEGRGPQLSQDATPFQAFSTSIGRQLRHPYRGENGLPLPLIHSAFDAYWRERRGKRRSRNPSIKDAIARDVNRLFTGAALSREVGDPVTTRIHRRIVSRIASTLTEAERSLPSAKLLSIIRSRSIALHGMATTAVSATMAKHLLEGSESPKVGISGWDHTELLMPDPDLKSLDTIGITYSKQSILDLLKRLGEIAIKVDDPGRTVPLMSVALRYLKKHPAPSKMELLLRIFRGTLPVARLVDHPTLADVYVDPDDLNADVAIRRVAKSPTPFMSRADLNLILEHRNKGAAVLTVDLLHRLVRAELVRSEIRARSPKNPLREAFFHVEDVTGIFARRLAGELQPYEAAAIGREVDIGTRLDQLKQAGLSNAAIATRLNTLGMRTLRGAAWTDVAVSKALRRPASNRVIAVETLDLDIVQPT